MSAHPAGCRDAVERDDVAERSDVGVADQGQGALGGGKVTTRGRSSFESRNRSRSRSRFEKRFKEILKGKFQNSFKFMFNLMLEERVY